MTTTLSIEEVQARLPEIIRSLAPGVEVVITDGQQPVARLSGERIRERKPRSPGNCKGMITLLVEDDEHLADFAEYMP